MKLKSLLLVSTIAIALPSFSNAAICLWSSAGPMSLGTNFDKGPNVHNAIVSNPNVGGAMLAAVATWDATDASGRIGDVTGGYITSSDCPDGSRNFIGAFNFDTTPCPVTVGLVSAETLATTVNHPDRIKSISINLDHPWSAKAVPDTTLTPEGFYDLQTTLTHELGHALGLDHQFMGMCGATHANRCAVVAAKETMAPDTPPSFSSTSGTGAEWCQRDLEYNDIQSINHRY